MAVVTICRKESLLLFPLFPHLFAMKWWGRMPWSSFFECWVLSQLFQFPYKVVTFSALRNRFSSLATHHMAYRTSLIMDWTRFSSSGIAVLTTEPQGRFILKDSYCCLVAKSVWLFATPWTVARQTLLSMEFCRQEYWSGLLFPPPGNIPHPGIEPMSLALTGWFFTSKPPGKPKGFYRGLQPVKVLV